jgi:hypothetical protein
LYQGPLSDNPWNDEATFRLKQDTQSQMTLKLFPDWEAVAEGHPNLEEAILASPGHFVLIFFMWILASMYS